MSQRKARYYRLLDRALGGEPKVAKVGTPLADRQVPIVIDGARIPHPSGRALSKRHDRALLTGEPEDRKTKTPRKSRDTTGRKG